MLFTQNVLKSWIQVMFKDIRNKKQDSCYHSDALDTKPQLIDGKKLEATSADRQDSVCLKITNSTDVHFQKRNNLLFASAKTHSMPSWRP
jgi:hypothetical protein